MAVTLLSTRFNIHKFYFVITLTSFVNGSQNKQGLLQYNTLTLRLPD